MKLYAWQKELLKRYFDADDAAIEMIEEIVDAKDISDVPGFERGAPRARPSMCPVDDVECPFNLYGVNPCWGMPCYGRGPVQRRHVLVAPPEDNS